MMDRTRWLIGDATDELALPILAPHELKRVRRQLGLSANQAARLLHVADGRVVRRWEAGPARVPGPAAVAVSYLAQGVGGVDETPPLPEHIAGRVGDAVWVVRLRVPRFVGRLGADGRIEPVQWIDDPMAWPIEAEEIKAILERARRAAEAFTSPGR